MNLRGYDPSAPVPASAALVGFLRALGAERVPPGLDPAMSRLLEHPLNVVLIQREVAR